MTKLTIGKNVAEIGASAFESCSALKTVKLGTGVKKIGKKAFYKCKAVTAFTISSTKLTSSKVGSQAFSQMGSKNYNKLVVKVPAKQKKAYLKWLTKKGLSKKAKVK